MSANDRQRGSRHLRVQASEPGERTTERVGEVSSSVRARQSLPRLGHPVLHGLAVLVDVYEPGVLTIAVGRELEQHEGTRCCARSGTNHAVPILEIGDEDQINVEQPFLEGPGSPATDRVVVLGEQSLDVTMRRAAGPGQRACRGDRPRQPRAPQQSPESELGQGRATVVGCAHHQHLERFHRELRGHPTSIRAAPHPSADEVGFPGQSPT